MINRRAVLQSVLLSLAPRSLHAEPAVQSWSGHTVTRKASQLHSRASTAGFTWSHMVASPSAFDAVRIHIYNSRSVPQTIDLVTVAASAAEGNGHRPVDPFGALSAFVPVSFDGRREANLASAKSGGNTANAIYQSLSSDWIPLPSYERIDKGSLPLAVVRFWSKSGMPFYNLAASTFGAVDGGFTWKTRISSDATGALTAADFGMRGISNWNDGGGIPFAIEFMVRHRGATVMQAGDSIHGGQYTHGCHAYGSIACTTLSTPSLPISFANFAAGGSSHAAFMANAANYVRDVRPEIAVLPIYSPNDGKPSETIANMMWSETIAAAEIVEAYGGVAILCTGIPAPPSIIPDTTREAFRTSLNMRARSQTSRLLIDLDAAISDGGNPARLSRIYDVDGLQIHPNDRGQQAMAVPAQMAIWSALKRLGLAAR